jgi:hypothetical protein
VEDRWLARVPEEDLGGVYQARATHRQANDKVVRAEVAVRDAERMLEVARHQKDAAEAGVDAARARLAAEEATGRADRIASAQTQLAGAQEALGGAEAKVEWREQDVEAKEAEEELRRRQAELAQANVALAEYQALSSSGDIRARDLNEADFRSAIAEARARVLEQQSEMESKRREAATAEVRWQAQGGFGGGGVTPADEE